jgi:hypothetical protein
MNFSPVGDVLPANETQLQQPAIAREPDSDSTTHFAFVLTAVLCGRLGSFQMAPQKFNIERLAGTA